MEPGQPIDPSLIPKSEKIYQIKEKNYEFSNANYDIGDYLKLLNIQPYEMIKILIKSGIYKWEKEYTLPEGVKLTMNGQDYKNGGKNNTVTIFMNEKHSDYDEDLKKEFSAKNRLNIGNDNRVEINGINFIEKINDLRTVATRSINVGIFSLMGRNPIFSLQQCSNELSTSPFINVAAFTVGTVFINAHVFFSKNIEEQQNEIFIIDANTSWNSRGNKDIVITSKDNTHLGEGCFFKKQDNIEYHDKFDEKYMK